MLAAFNFASYSTAVHKLEAGDRIVMYTDGILEASNAEGHFFGLDTLCDLLAQTRQLSPARTADTIISSVRRWSGTQDDDLTVLICDYIPKKTSRLDSAHAPSGTRVGWRSRRRIVSTVPKYG
jgi:sigma-B regulation protein RsbU (phosphoserine phosphatase)